MTDLERAAQDLEFVRSAVTRGRSDLGTAPIYFLWAAIVGIGFALPDFAPHLALGFWTVGGLAGGAASIFLGARHERMRGVCDRAQGWRQGQHWLATGAALGVVMLAIPLGRLQAPDAAPVLMAIAGLGYFLGGVHLHPPLRWAGGVMLVSSVALLFLPLPYLWTACGLAVFVALVVGGICAARAERAARA